MRFARGCRAEGSRIETLFRRSVADCAVGGVRVYVVGVSKVVDGSEGGGVVEEEGLRPVKVSQSVIFGIERLRRVEMGRLVMSVLWSLKLENYRDVTEVVGPVLVRVGSPANPKGLNDTPRSAASC